VCVWWKARKEEERKEGKKESEKNNKKVCVCVCAGDQVPVKIHWIVYILLYQP
jgi:hypothetical protein